MRSKLDQDIWSNLLQYEAAQKKQFTEVTITGIQESFDLSYAKAKMYHTLLSLKDGITVSIESDLKMRQLKQENNDAKKNQEILNQKLEELSEMLYVVHATKINHVLPSYSKIITPRLSDLGFITNLSDTHVEETVTRESVNGFNEFNLDVARHRFCNYFSQLDSKAIASGTKPQLLLQLGGDFITGWIHPEGVEVNSLNPIQAIRFATDNVISGIQMLIDCDSYSHIMVVCTPGNHARITEKKRYATGYRNSYEYFMFLNIKEYVEQRLPKNKVTVVVAESEFTLVKFMDKNICCSHGDHFKYAGGIGGLFMPAIRWVHKMSQVFDADLFSIGHWHSYNALPGAKLLINGSLIGYSAFAMGHAFKPEPAKLQLQHVDPVNGFTVNDPIIVQ